MCCTLKDLNDGRVVFLTKKVQGYAMYVFYDFSSILSLFVMDVNKIKYCLQNDHKANFITLKIVSFFVCRTLASFFFVLYEPLLTVY